MKKIRTKVDGVGIQGVKTKKDETVDVIEPGEPLRKNEISREKGQLRLIKLGSIREDVAKMLVRNGRAEWLSETKTANTNDSKK